MKIFKNLFKSDYEKALELANKMASERVPENVYFSVGRETGFDEGFKAAMEKKIKDTTELNQTELSELTAYLVNNDIELCYDNSINGMRARKVNFGWKEKGLQYAVK
jgi:hypothetical protein